MPLCKHIRSFLTVTFLIFTFILGTHGVLQQRTIDDEFGDFVTGVKPLYFGVDLGSWKQGATCSNCSAHPNPAMVFQHTWHDRMLFAGEAATGVQFTFTGTSLSVFCILPNTPSPDFATNYSLTFLLDEKPVGGTFTHTPDSTSDFLYNVSVFSIDDLSNTQHTFSMTDSSANTIILFDYASYTFEDEGSVPPPPSTTGTNHPVTNNQGVSPIATTDRVQTTNSVTTTSSSTSLGESQSSTTILPTVIVSSTDDGSTPSSATAAVPQSNVTNPTTPSKLPKILGPTLAVFCFILLIGAAYLMFRKRRQQVERLNDTHNIDPFDDGSSPTEGTAISSRKALFSAGLAPESDEVDPRVSMRQLQVAVANLHTQQQQILSELVAPPTYSHGPV